MLYKTLLKTIWSYAIQIWGEAADFELDFLQMLHTINNVIQNDIRIASFKK